MYNWLRSSGIQFLCITIFILYLGYGSTLVQNDTFTSIVFLFLLIIFLVKGHRFDPVLFYTLIVWLAINLASAFIINTKQHLSFISLIGVTLRIVIPYLIIKIIGIQFFEKVIRYVYVLSIIGLVLFSIQVLYPDLFFTFSDRLNFMTQSEQHAAGGWYIFVYMFSGWATARNCGFAWEPGAYSCILIFFLSFQLAKEKFRIDKYSFVFIVALITTLSTSGFFALFLIISSIFFYRKKLQVNPFYLLGFIGVVVFSIHFYNTSEFMKVKIDRYIEEQKIEEGYLNERDYINRVEEFHRGLEQSFYWPFGNGILDSDYRIQKYGYGSGSNSLSAILMQWGWIGMIFFLFTTSGLFYYYSKKFIVAALLTVAFCMVLYSNPFMMRYIVFASFFYYYLYVKGPKRSLFIES